MKKKKPTSQRSGTNAPVRRFTAEEKRADIIDEAFEMSGIALNHKQKAGR